MPRSKARIRKNVMLMTNQIFNITANLEIRHTHTHYIYIYIYIYERESTIWQTNTEYYKNNVKISGFSM